MSISATPARPSEHHRCQSIYGSSPSENRQDNELKEDLKRITHSFYIPKKDKPNNKRMSGTNIRHISIGLQPRSSIGCALLTQKHIHAAIGIISIFESEHYQAASIRRHSGLTQLQRVHFTQPLEAGYRDFALTLFSFDAVQNTLLFMFIKGVKGLLTQINSIKRRHGNKHVACSDNRPEVFKEQSA